MLNTSRGPNPFETLAGAEAWIQNVEGHDAFRIQQIYPRVKAWASSLNPYSTIADVGCGQGVCSELLPDSMHYFGFDPSSLLIQRAINLPTHSNKMFFIGDAQNIALPEHSVDAALSVHVWFHLPDVMQPSRELARILKPGGKVFIRGKLCPVLGKISMDLTVVDVTELGSDLPMPGEGAEVLGAHLSVDDQADAGGTIGYEVLTSLKGRYNRIYVGDGNIPE